jgi:2-oxoglutarate dehydrogenase E2 component (dihydrolipoamide succinyltransferase)
MGESIMEATVLGWLKEVGDKIDQDESLIEVATDKVDTEVPSPVGGILKKKLAKEGDVIQIGRPVAIIEVNNGQDVYPVYGDDAQIEHGMSIK